MFVLHSTRGPPCLRSMLPLPSAAVVCSASAAACCCVGHCPVQSGQQHCLLRAAGGDCRAETDPDVQMGNFRHIVPNVGQDCYLDGLWNGEPNVVFADGTVRSSLASKPVIGTPEP